MNPKDQFINEKKLCVEKMSKDEELKDLSLEWLKRASKHKYAFMFEWMGRPIIQLPSDMFIAQELIWDVKPDLIIETGIAHGGSIIFYASMLQLLYGGDENDNSKVIGIDIDIRSHNREEIEKHPMMKKIIMLEGSSTDESIVSKVKELAKPYNNIMLSLDSNHTYGHVLDELNVYSELVSIGSYIIVWDTTVELLTDDFFQDRPWKKGNSPYTAVCEFLEKNDNFVIDEEVCNKALITGAYKGFLKRVK